MKSDDKKKQMDSSMQNKNDKVKSKMDKLIDVSQKNCISEKTLFATSINRNDKQGSIQLSIS